ncbi:unnamed protein product, partial [marine sediment metagenome]
DVIVGAILYNNRDGRAYIYYGGADMDSTPDVILDGELGAASRFCYELSSGDINNDGYSDVLVGTNRYNNWTGRVYVYFGGLSMDSDPDVIFDGENEGDRLSFYNLSAGDVNNDGYDDVLVGAGLWNSLTGRVYVFYGSASMDPFVDAALADIVLDGENVGDMFGDSVSSGDINNDGYDDVIIAADEYNNATGRVYVYHGGLSMDTMPDIILDGENEQNWFGIPTRLVGDVNGDGYNDVAIGGDHRVHIFFGPDFNQ